MIHLKRINEWKTTEDAKLDDTNLEELEDVFLTIKDLDCEDFEIIVTAPKAEKGFLLAKKTPKRTGGKKKKAETLIATKPVEDLWFM